MVNLLSGLTRSILLSFCLLFAYFNRKPKFLKDGFMSEKLTSVYQKQMFSNRTENKDEGNMGTGSHHEILLLIKIWRLFPLQKHVCSCVDMASLMWPTFKSILDIDLRLKVTHRNLVKLTSGSITGR